MAEPPTAHLRHFATGRLRVKISEKRHDQAYFARVADAVSAWDSVERVEVNPLTASVLVFFKDLVALTAENALKNDLFSVDFDEIETVAEAGFDIARQVFGGQTSRAVAAADGALRRLSLGAADLRSGVALALLAAGTYELFRGNIAAPAVTLFWYAGEMLRLQDRIDAAQSRNAAGKG